MKTITLTLLLCFTITICQSQSFKIGKVDKEEFTTSEEILEGAIYLEKYRETFFEYDGNKGWILITEIKERIKITSKEGLDYATNKVYLYKNSPDYEELRKFKAFTHNLSGKKVIKESLSKDAYFETEKNENWTEVSWTMPNIQVGSIVEWEYTVISPFLKIDELIIQENIPVRNYEALIRTPQFFSFNLIRRGYFNIVPKQETVFRSLSIHQDSKDAYGKRVVAGQSNNYSWNIYEIHSTFKKTNIPALKEEPYVINKENYRWAVNFELTTITYPNEPEHKISATWEEVSNTIYKSKNFGEQLENTKYLEDEVSRIKAMNLTIEETLNEVYNTVKQRMNWDGKRTKYTNGKIAKAYRDRTGNVSEINLMLISLLREFHINANPVLLTTNDQKVSLFPTLDGFNYVIAAAEINDKMYLLDATEKLGTPNVLPRRTFNTGTSRLVKQDGTSTEIQLQPKDVTQDLMHLEYTLNDDLSISGTLKERYSKIESLYFRKNHSPNNTDARIDELVKEINIEDITNYEVENYKNLEDPIVEGYTYEINKGVDVIAGEIYLQPLLFKKLATNPFKSETRDFPVDFLYPFSTTKSVKLNIPEGFNVSYLPKSEVVEMPNKLGRYIYQISQQGNVIVIRSITTFNQSTIPQQYYKELKQFYNKRIEKETEKIIISNK